MCIMKMSELSWKTVFSYKVSIYKWVKIGSSKSFFTPALEGAPVRLGPPWKFLIIFISFSLLLIDNHGNLYRSGKSFVVCCWLWKAFKISQPYHEKSQKATVTNANGRCEKSHTEVKDYRNSDKKDFQGSWILMLEEITTTKTARDDAWLYLSRESRKYFLSHKDLAIGNCTDDGKQPNWVCCADVICMTFMYNLEDTPWEFVWDFMSLMN